ncbi:DUF3008 family protein [Burkholderia aenigmatica]|uniref:Uncharacterized protein n=1 Tax=Burkholderia aenigmatica TaxID=2015348 RepID=A0A228HSX2_9BURK|nr:DUF3008 family protein [Burkholderia aenigmatica]OXI33283.1 hypothetical protein CFB84_39435 [Burkholderia aenigmatica]
MTAAGERIARTCRPSRRRARQRQARNHASPIAGRQRAAGAARPARRGRTNHRDIDPQEKSTARSMSEKARETRASIPGRGKPEHQHDA